MKRNGFIATSILYSFFLVFITLFVSLVANYIHNQVLIRRQNEEARAKLAQINNMDISQISVGEYVRFETHHIDIVSPHNVDYDWDGGVDSYLRETNWIYAYKDTDPSGNFTNYYFISDTNVLLGTSVKVIVEGSENRKYSFVSDGLNAVRRIKNHEYDGYDLINLSLTLSDSFPSFNDTSLTGYDVEILKASLLQKIEEYAKNYLADSKASTDDKMQYTFAVNKNIFYAFGGYAVDYDIAEGCFDGECYFKNTGGHSGYYYWNSYNDVALQMQNLHKTSKELCGVNRNLDDGSVPVSYTGDENNVFSFIGVEGETNSAIIGDKYQSKADFCNYASSADELPDNASSIGVRLQMKLRVKNGQQIHIDSGRGTDNDAYFIKNGV